MKRSLLILIIGFLILQCNSIEKNQYSETDIKFQNYIGKQKSKALEQGIKEFEYWLTSKYSQNNIKENYREYLQYIYDHSYDSIPWDLNYPCSIETKELVRSSGLYNDFNNSVEYRVIIDTIKNEYYRIPNNADSNEIIPIVQKFRQGTNIDSLYQDSKYMVYFNRKGKYYKGLKKHYINNTIISDYLEMKELGAGGISPTFTAYLFLQSGVNYNDYIIKVILFHECCNY